MPQVTDFNLKARGGVSFKADDLQANLDAMVSYSNSRYTYSNSLDDISLQDLGGAILLSLRKGNIETAATICAYKAPNEYSMADYPSLTVASSFTLKIHEIMKNITPIISCTIGNNTSGARAALQAGVQTSF